MKITRIGSNKEIVEEVDRIEITVGDKEYILTDRIGSLDIHACHDEILVKPAYANVVQIVANDRS